MAAIPLGLLLGFLGPFGSYPAYPTAPRYAFWVGLTVAGALAAVAANAVLPTTRLRAGPLRVVSVAFVSALPMTFVVAWTMSLVQPGRFFAPQQMPALFAAVAAVQLLIVYATTSAPRSHAAAAPAPTGLVQADEDQASSPVFPLALLSRLPPGSGSDIIALEAP